MHEKFLEMMQQLLKEEYEEWYKLLSTSPLRAMRINTLKTSRQTFFEDNSYPQKPSVFSDRSYYVENIEGLGVTPAYLSGTFYLQEPSAASAVTILDPQENETVLDMCAAPGSKTTQIAEALQNTGLLVANEINASRAKILVENIERHGAANVIVTNNDTGTIAKAFAGFFDKVLCDAPCSGEGMMRKNEIAQAQWSYNLVKQCAALQQGILENAYCCLKENGILVYSTCTFNTLENEENILAFLEKHPDMEIVDIQANFGRKALLKDNLHALRIFPMDGGEGHFVCKMQKKSTTSHHIKQIRTNHIDKIAQDYLQTVLKKQYPYYYQYQNRIYGGTYPFLDLRRLHVLRNQVYLGDIEKNRFVSQHALWMSSYTDFRHVLEVSEEEAMAFAKGMMLQRKTAKGDYAICYKKHSLGYGHSDGNTVKNKYPKSLRLR